MTITCCGERRVGMADGDVLDLSSPLVSEMASDFDLSEETVTDAEKQAKRVDEQYTIGRSPRTIAVSSIYMHANLNNEKITQEELSNITGVHRYTISKCYREIARAEGYPVKLPGDDDAKEVVDEIQSDGILTRVKRWI